MNDSIPAQADPYANIVELYDLEHEEFTADRDLWLNFATAIGDPILEMGCGSGRLAIPIAQAGFDITGLDRSPAMLERAATNSRNRRSSGKITWFQGEMTEADKAPGGPFGIVLLSLNAIMHLPTAEEQRLALESAYRALDPKGQLVIDTMNPTPTHLSGLDGSPHLEGSWHLDDGSTVDKWSWRKVRPADQIIETVIWYDELSAKGDFRRTRTAFALRYVHPNELLLMLELAGFSDFQIYGSYDLDPLTDESDRLIVTAEVTPSGGSSR